MADDTRQISSMDDLDESARDAMNKKIPDINLSARAMNCLRNAGITTVRGITVHSEAQLLRTKNLGRKTLREIKERLRQWGLAPGMFRLQRMLIAVIPSSHLYVVCRPSGMSSPEAFKHIKRAFLDWRGCAWRRPNELVTWQDVECTPTIFLAEQGIFGFKRYQVGDEFDEVVLG